VPGGRIVWRTPRVNRDKLFEKLNNFRLELPADLGPRLQLRTAEALFSAGIPALAGAQTPREDAIGLLQLAAEVEHALLVQYLYASQSVRGPMGRTIAHVGVQEMGHLVTVQNLLLALTGLTTEGIPAGLHLGRDRIRAASDRNPMPLILEPVSRSALAKFVVIERPAAIPDAALAARVAQLEQSVTAEGITPHPVYALYAAIRWIFQADDAAGNLGLSTELGFEPGWHLRDSDFIDATTNTRFASEPIEWHSIPALIVVPTTDRTEALSALDQIAAQGEGLPGTQDSHFAAFIGALDQFEAGGVVVKALPRTPRVASQPQPEDPGATSIVNDYTTLWAELLNQVYGLLILDLAWAISQPRDGSRGALIDLCIDTMNRVVRPLAAFITTQPLAADPLTVAGPTFGLADESVPTTIADFRARFTLHETREAQTITAIRARPEFAADATGAQRALDVEQLTARRQPYLP